MFMNKSDSKQKVSYFSNPMVRRLSKITETSEDHATYKGIILKCIYFMFMILAGVAVGLVIHTLPCGSVADDSGFTVKYSEIVAIGVSLVLFIACPILATFIQKTVPVTGALGCVATGYFITAMGLLIPDYGSAVLLALVLTFAVVLAMQLVYTFLKDRLQKNFYTVLVAVLGAYVIGGALIGICFLIPGLNGVVDFIKLHTAISIAISVIGVVIAALFLLSDFNAIHKTVENKLPKKYEWSAAYSLCFTVIWLYFEILNLIGMASDSKGR